ncbi:putative transposase [Cucumis melo var. makuwa]|uniref:Transposase n=1 Tax=Cucumis melo var. makuwa TaxID=1194695 RepID=A0A5A7UBK9_CUCMM|nr:putative transposase [Cucumis melo var. makuwa]
MHIEKNVCMNLLGTLLNIPGKTKDGLQSRRDLEQLGIRPELVSKVVGNRTYIPSACYTLSKSEKRTVCQSLSKMIVSEGYSSNIKNLVSIDTLKLTRLKSHDCHVLMQQLLSVAVRGALPKHVATELELSNNTISDTLRWISHGPSPSVITYSSYVMNGICYNTEHRDGVRNVQNSGVLMDCCSDDHLSVGADEDVAQKIKGKLPPSIDRATLWKHARVGKDGEFINKEVEEILGKIDKLQKDVDKTYSVSDDILTQALETPEHRGRVRGVGGLITSSFYFHKHIPSQPKETHITIDVDTNWKKEKSQILSEYSQMAKKMLKLKSLKRTRETSLDAHSGCNQNIRRPCSLAIGKVDNIVATGTVFERISTGEIVYGVRLGEGDVGVLIELACDSHSLLPIPIVESIYSIHDAIGSHVPWPKYLIVIEEQKKTSSKKSHELEALKGTKSKMNELKLPTTIRFVLRHVEKDMEDEYLTIPVDTQEIFGYSFNVNVMKDSMKQLCLMEELAFSVILSYMICLYESDPSILEEYAFMNPGQI